MGRMTNPVSVIYTDAARRDVGELRGATLDLEVGDSDSFEVEAPATYDVAGGSLVYVDGTSLGGIVDHRVPTTGSPLVTYRGRTWAGVLAERVVTPPAGSAYRTYSGDANDVLRALVADLDLGWLFEVPAGRSGVTLSGRFDRYCDLWGGLRKAARASGARVSVTWGGRRAELTMVPVRTFEANPSEAPATVDEPWRAINHLVCLGQGELAERTVLHLYADASGAVSTTQSLFGADLREATYEYSNADAAELLSEGTSKLLELQERSSVSVDTSALDEDVALGDLVTATDDETGATATAEVARIVARVEGGQLSMTCEAGESSISSGVSLSGSSEHSGGGVAYTAGDGISISGGVISAEVTQAELDSVSATASAAATAASNAGAAAGAAEAAAAAKVASVTGSAPISATTDAGHAVTVSHALSGVVAGKYGPAANLAPAWGETVTIPPTISMDQEGHVTKAEARALTVPSTAATGSTAGLMSAADKAKLDSVEAGANAYELPPATTSSLGGVRPDGTTVTVAADGTISAQAGGAASFLAAHPVGSYHVSSLPDDPGVTYGGTWALDPGEGPYMWRRTA